MFGRVCPTLRRSFAAVALTAVSFAHPGPAAEPVRPAAAANGVAERYYPEVRLRKMHLVRPDLILYPISFEVYC